MASEPLNYWFDGQLRRFMLEFTRTFSFLEYQTGRQSDGETLFRKVPVSLAKQNRQVAHIMKNQSENVMLSVPAITCLLKDLQHVPERRQDPLYSEKIQIWEQQWNEEQSKYTGGLGASYTLERAMPVPYNLTMQVDIWTSNELQKHQIAEQLLPLFNPSFNLQTSENVFDWTALSIIELKDTQWSSRQIPVGSEDEIDVMTLTFECPIWLNPPAILQRQKLIHQIVTNIHHIQSMTDMEYNEGDALYWSENDLMARIITTPGNHQIRVEKNTITNLMELTLLGSGGEDYDLSGNIFKWQDLITQYGKCRETISQIRLKTNTNLDDHESDIVGTIEFHPSQPNKLLWNINTLSLPVNTLPAIDGVIDPHKTHPENGLVVSPGRRYLIVDEIGSSEAWGNIEASADDILEFNGTKWVVAFKASNYKGKVEYVLNQNPSSRKQFKWTGQEWILAIEGDYLPGYWRLFL